MALRRMGVRKNFSKNCESSRPFFLNGNAILARPCCFLKERSSDDCESCSISGLTIDVD
jgi:hypothetical protein